MVESDLGYAYRTVVLFDNMYFLLHLLKKNENSINAVYLALSKNRKNYFPARKINLSFNRKN